jgi:hypothetical protein
MISWSAGHWKCAVNASELPAGFLAPVKINESETETATCEPILGIIQKSDFQVLFTNLVSSRPMVRSERLGHPLVTCSLRIPKLKLIASRTGCALGLIRSKVRSFQFCNDGSGRTKGPSGQNRCKTRISLNHSPCLSTGIPSFSSKSAASLPSGSNCDNPAEHNIGCTLSRN